MIITLQIHILVRQHARHFKSIRRLHQNLILLAFCAIQLATDVPLPKLIVLTVGPLNIEFWILINVNVTKQAATLITETIYVMNVLTL